MIDYERDPWGKDTREKSLPIPREVATRKEDAESCHGAAGVEGQRGSIFIRGIHHLNCAMPSAMMG
jgi:hypothetical protein